jgi:hypothetical protein
VAFWQPRIHNLDHRAIAAFIQKGKVGKLKRYRKSRQTFPLQLPPAEEQDAQTRLFGELRATCKDDAPTRRKHSDWISEESWWLIAYLAMLRRTGRLCQTGGHCMQHQIGVLLCKDRADRTERVGTLIESKLTGGNVQEAFRHLKGWYWAASEMQAKLCFQTMECQTSERVHLYARRLSLGDSLPINVKRTKINDDVPLDGEIRIAVSELSNGRAAGASRMRAEQAKEWLRGIHQEDNPERLGGGPGDGDHWCLFVQLVQAAWTHGKIPCQLLWIIVALIPKGGGEYHSIGLLEPIWKVIERIINHQLDAFNLHDSLHGCRNKHGTGTAIIEAKLAQQLLYLKLKPFYGVFLNLRKAFDAMDRERCILILEGYGAGPQLVRLV